MNGTEVAIELLDTQVFVGVSSVGLVGDFLDFGAVKFVSSEFCPLAGFHCELLGFPIFPPWKDTEKNTIAISQGRFVSGNFGQHHRHHH